MPDKTYLVRLEYQCDIEDFESHYLADQHLAAPLVRCKDCIYKANRGATSLRWVPCMDNEYNDMFFCAYGESTEYRNS